MTDSARAVGSPAIHAERPSPAAALEQAFERVHRGPMAGVAMLNPALRVQAVGFRPWQSHWLGVLITPWFMNLLLLPRFDSAWLPLAERDKRTLVFPAGWFEFIGGRDPVVGEYQACSLFSPMFDFADQGGAQATALAVLEGLFQPQGAATTAGHKPKLSKRDFLFGRTPKADREP
jgi:[NiFe] hydrogenase assembly HybE family chaperone